MGIDFCNATERMNVKFLFQESGKDMDIKPLYKYLCPVIMCLCFINIVFNGILISISKQSRVVNKSPILLLSLNLAMTDLIASLLNGLAILFNSYLTEVEGVDMKDYQCPMLKFEVVRCAALVASALHLLALAFVHYKGIVNPLHYR